MTELRVEINGTWRKLRIEAHWTLLRVLREEALQTDVKYGCGEGVCGACAVILDGVAVNACSVLAVQAEGRSVLTVAGLGSPDDLHPLQREFAERGAVQCGFCTPGMVIGGLEATLLGAAGSPHEIRHSLAGNLCRCTGYGGIVDAVAAFRDSQPDG
jgi:aerobic-type carbon monoxide dehydrogenase small subunit (CoxS/CutS family)